MDAAVPALWLSEADVVALLDLRVAMRAIEAALLAEHRGEAESMRKTHVAWPGGTLHALGGVAQEWAGTKTWVHSPRGANPLLLLFDRDSGALRAVVEAFALGQLRTAAVSGLATGTLAAADADRLAIVGSGKQALPQVAAVAAVRRLRRVDVFSPTREHAAAFAARVRAQLGIDAQAAASVEAAVAGAPIVTVATRATAPFLGADMLAAGAHLNAIGAITPERAELAPDVLPRCAVVAVDSVASARELSRELRNYYGSAAAWSAVASLSQVVAGDVRRASDTALTLFKAMGLGLADVALGIAVCERAGQAGRGRALAAAQRAEIEWRVER